MMCAKSQEIVARETTKLEWKHLHVEKEVSSAPRPLLKKVKIGSHSRFLRDVYIRMYLPRRHTASTAAAFLKFDLG